MIADIDLLIFQQHTVDSLDGALGGLSGLVLNETISLRATLFIGSHLARKNVAESGKCVMKSLSRCQM